MNELERVRRAISRIEKGWTQGLPAKESLGLPVSPDNQDAVCWCLIGALSLGDNSLWKGHEDLGALFLDEAAIFVHKESLMSFSKTPTFPTAVCRNLWFWNDDPTRTQEEVLSLLRRVETRLLEKDIANDPL